VLLADKLPVDCEPLMALLPVQAPEAAHAVALADDQVSVALLPAVRVLGLTARLNLGVAAVTETTADCVALPPAPMQVNVYVVVASSAAVASEPLRASLPLHPPEAEHELALLLVHVSVVVLPADTVLGLALMAMTGAAAATVTVVD
jgi:hypothetical protein